MTMNQFENVCQIVAAAVISFLTIGGCVYYNSPSVKAEREKKIKQDIEKHLKNEESRKTKRFIVITNTGDSISINAVSYSAVVYHDLLERPYRIVYQFKGKHDDIIGVFENPKAIIDYNVIINK